MITFEDMKTHLYSEQITTISRADTEIMERAIKSAENRAKGFLSRYDYDFLFDQVGDDRDETLVMYLKDMATWNFITLANVNADLEYREKRNTEALAWLRSIQKGQEVPVHWPPAVPEDNSTFFHFTSAPKRETRF